MKRPLYDMHDRYEVRLDETLTASIIKLNLAILHFRRDLDINIRKVFKL